MTELLGAAVVAAWLVLLFGRNRFWCCDQVLGQRTPTTAPAVVALVPARNEAATIAACVRSLASQDYAGSLTIVVVDDGSEDATGTIVRDVAASASRPVHLIPAPPKPAGWSGKVAAQAAGLAAIDEAGLAVPWLWLTDADVVHDPSVLARLVGEAQDRAAGLVSVMVHLSTVTFWERWLAPAFVYFFQMLYPFPAVNRAERRVAAAAGGCILVDRSQLEHAGSFAAIKGELIDDVALARRIKAGGGRLWLGTSDASRSLRRYGFRSFVDMVARTAFTELRHSFVRLATAVLGLGLVFVAPPLLAVLGSGVARAGGLVGCGMMFWSFRPTLRAYGLGSVWLLGLPAAAAAYLGMTVLSAWRHYRGQGATWHGRRYAG